MSNFSFSTRQIAIGVFLAIASAGEIGFGVWLLVWGGKRAARSSAA